MPSDKKTHRLVKNPQISARFLADFMAASEQAKRTIVRKCKFQAIGRVVQHDEAKAAISKFIRDGGDIGELQQRAQSLRDRMADDDFDRDLFDHNADYIDRFAAIYVELQLPKADVSAPGQPDPIDLNGVKVNADLSFRLQRVTKTNKVRIGAGMLRYAKGTPLPEAVAEWQSAFLFGYLTKKTDPAMAEPEWKLCVTIDAHGGVCHPAPSNSISRFQNMEAACATIAERWPNIPPPPNAVF
jgi:hypothetical protein